MYFAYREGFEFRTQKDRGYKIGYATSTDSTQLGKKRS